MKITRFLIVLFTILFGNAYSQKTHSEIIPLVSEQRKEAADIAWRMLPKHPGMGLKRIGLGRDSLIKFNQEEEQYRIDFRSKGLTFWRNFPEDKRRYDWLFEAIHITGFTLYPKNIKEAALLRYEEQYEDKVHSIPINKPLVEQWNKIYPELRSEYMASKDISEDRKLAFKTWELLSSFYHPENNSGKLNLNSLKKLFEDCFKDCISKTKPPYTELRVKELLKFMGRLYSNREKMRVGQKELIAFTRPYLKSKDSILRNWAQSKLAVFDLQTNPFRFKGKSIDGKEIDLAKLRGKVVLLDFWNTTCHACIYRMVELKPVYEKYKDRGFEVISISIDAKDQEADVRRVKEKIGASWPTVITGPNNRLTESGGLNYKAYETSVGGAIMKRYGWTAVPQLVLLDKNGLMKKYNGILRQGDIEPIVKALLAERY